MTCESERRAVYRLIFILKGIKKSSVLMLFLGRRAINSELITEKRIFCFSALFIATNVKWIPHQSPVLNAVGNYVEYSTEQRLLLSAALYVSVLESFGNFFFSSIISNNPTRRNH